MYSSFFFFNDTATTEIYTLSLHDALPICEGGRKADMTLVWGVPLVGLARVATAELEGLAVDQCAITGDRFTLIAPDAYRDRKSTRLNSSHANISYAVFCLKKKHTNTNKQH